MKWKLTLRYYDTHIQTRYWIFLLSYTVRRWISDFYPLTIDFSPVDGFYGVVEARILTLAFSNLLFHQIYIFFLSFLFFCIPYVALVAFRLLRPATSKLPGSRVIRVAVKARRDDRLAKSNSYGVSTMSLRVFEIHFAEEDWLYKRISKYSIVSETTWAAH